MDFELSEELKMIRSLARDFVEEQLKPLERDILGRAADQSDARAYLPAEKEAGLVRMVKEMGLWGIGVPEELGGVSLSTLGLCVVEEELACTVVPFRFGDITPILYDCSPAQRHKYLIPALDYRKRPYLALIEPDGAGHTDMKVKAVPANGGYIINGEKTSYSRPGEDYFVVVFATTPQGTTCFLVDKGWTGLSVSGGQTIEGWSTQTRKPLKLVFTDCPVPEENMLGEAGKAFSLGGKWLPGRRIVRGARSVGAARRLFEEATNQAQSFESFGQPIYHRSDIKATLADMSAHIHAARLMVYEAAWKADKGKLERHDSIVLKLFTNRLLNNIADDVNHIFGGTAFRENLPMERLGRRILENNTAEIALARQRNIIAADILKIKR
jgi:acyl-CoA dehydrogenase